MSGQIDRWWGTVGQDEFFSTTWTVEVEEDGEYSLDIDIENFLTQQWDLSPTARVNIWLQPFTNPDSLIGTREFNREGTANFGSLKAGTYELEVSGFVVPETPVVEKVKFQLEKIESDNVLISDTLNALFVADHPDNADLSPDRRQQYEAWIDKYAPILLFDAGITGDTSDDEAFAVPFNVSQTWGESGISKPAGDSQESFNLSRYASSTHTPNNTNGAIYASVLERGDEVAINYYFHYPYSDWGDYEGFNTHQGDWEGITVFLKGGQPDRVAYAQHLFGEIPVTGPTYGSVVIPWWDLIEREGDRPKVYVGLGGHASYPYPGLTDVSNPFGDRPEFHKGDFEVFKPDASQVHYLPRAGSIQTLEDENAWLLYSGTWGESGNSLSGSDAAPRGPMFLASKASPLDIPDPGLGDRWLDPWAWSTNNVKTPGTEPYGATLHRQDDYNYYWITDDHTILVPRQVSGAWDLDAAQYGTPLTIVAGEGDDTYKVIINSDFDGVRGINISDRGGKDTFEIVDISPDPPYGTPDPDYDREITNTSIPYLNPDPIDFPILSKPKPGKIGLEKIGTTLVLDLNRNGTAELVRGKYEDVTDLAITNFFSHEGGAGSGFIEEFVRYVVDQGSERSRYDPLMGEEILNFFGSSNGSSASRLGLALADSLSNKGMYSANANELSDPITISSSVFSPFL